MATQEQHIKQNTSHQQDIIDCESQPPIQEIILKGERHSGTNWVTRLLEQNIKGTIEADQQSLAELMEQNVQNTIQVDQSSLDIGWKHGFLPPLGWGRPLQQTDLLVVVTRDVFTWLPKMYHETYDPEMSVYQQDNMAFHKFIMRPYAARCQPLSNQKKNGQSQYQKVFCKSLADYENLDEVSVTLQTKCNDLLLQYSLIASHNILLHDVTLCFIT